MSKTNLLIYAPMPDSASGKTHNWGVTNIGGDRLGLIHWHAPWRRYVFSPNEATLFDAACMTELAEFTMGATEEQKRRAAVRREGQA